MIQVSEVTQVKEISVIPYSSSGEFRLLDPLHEVSGVKVPRPASPFITHETSLSEEMAVAVSRGMREIMKMYSVDLFYDSLICLM